MFIYFYMPAVRRYKKWKLICLLLNSFFVNPFNIRRSQKIKAIIEETVFSLFYVPNVQLCTHTGYNSDNIIYSLFFYGPSVQLCTHSYLIFLWTKCTIVYTYITYFSMYQCIIYCYIIDNILYIIFFPISKCKNVPILENIL